MMARARFWFGKSGLVRIRILSSIKQLLVPHGRASRRIIWGPMQGLRISMDLSCQTQLWLGLAEAELHPWIQRFSYSVGTFIDIGAGEGELSFYFLCRTRARKVIAFEPADGSQRIFETYLLLNGPQHDSRLALRSEFVGTG